ncbi:MAG: TonB family protein [Deltaproteobacteria bacterium]|nr:TonB family protein [Deltaproteobacteria bacterium]
MSIPVSKRVFKIGLIQDGKLVSEVILKEKQPVTIGTDPTNTITVVEKNMPKRHVMLMESSGNFQLHTIPNMEGLIVSQAGTRDLAAIGTTAPKSPGGGLVVDLGPGGKGKINIGNSTVLFQVIPAPPPPPLTQLPRELRGSFSARIDRPLLVLLVISALIHVTAVSYIAALPEPEIVPDRHMDQLVSLVSEDIIPTLTEVTPDAPAEEKKPEEAGGGGAKKGGGAPKGGGSGEQGPPEPAGVETKGLLSLITTQGSEGAVADLLGDSGSGLDEQLGKIGAGVEVAGKGTGTLGSSKGGGGTGPGSVGAGDLGKLGTAGSKEGSGTGEKEEKKVKANMSASGGSSGSLDASSVSAQIRKYTGGVRNCYERQLKIDPSLSGSVRVSFSIGGDGSVQGCSVTSSSIASSEVGSCVCSRIERWRFEPSADGGGSSVNYSFVFTPASE